MRNVDVTWHFLSAPSVLGPILKAPKNVLKILDRDIVV